MEQLEFRTFLLHVAYELTERQFGQLKFVLKGFISAGKCEEMKEVFNYFQELERRLYLTPTNFGILKKALDVIGRPDLVEEIENKEQRFNDLFRPQVKAGDNLEPEEYDAVCDSIEKEAKNLKSSGRSSQNTPDSVIKQLKSTTIDSEDEEEIQQFTDALPNSDNLLTAWPTYGKQKGRLPHPTGSETGSYMAAPIPQYPQTDKVAPSGMALDEAQSNSSEDVAMTSEEDLPIASNPEADCHSSQHDYWGARPKQRQDKPAISSGNKKQNAKEQVDQVLQLPHLLKQLNKQSRKMEQQPRAKKDEQLRKMEQQLRAEKDKQLRKMEQQLRAEKDEQLRKMEQQVRAEKDEQLRKMEQQLRAEKDEQLRKMKQQLRAEKDEQLRKMEQQVRAEKDKQLRKMKQQLRAEKDEQLREMEQQLREKDEKQQNLQRQLWKNEKRQKPLQGLEKELRDREQDIVDIKKDLLAAEEKVSKYESQLRTRDWVLLQDDIQSTNKCLGDGSFGRVVEGRYCGSPVAIKRLHRTSLSPQERSLFEREMDIASRCRHPCLLQFIGATIDESPQFVTELMETSLRALLGKQQLSETEVSVISRDVARALNYLHQRKPDPIVHRDVSSANVLLWKQNDQWRGKLSDYGTVKFLQEIMTKDPGAMIYSAPEVGNPYNQTVKIDVYSFGILFCEMCTAKLPVIENRVAHVRLVTNREFRALIMWCIEEDPEMRPSMEEVIDMLEPAV